MLCKHVARKERALLGKPRNRWANVSVQWPDPCISSKMNESRKRRITVPLLLCHINTLMSGEEEGGDRVSKMNLDSMVQYMIFSE